MKPPLRLNGAMSFFTYLPGEPDKDDTEARTAPRWWVPSDDEVPVAVPLVRVLGQAQGVAIVLQRADVYSDGIRLVIRTEVRVGRHVTAAAAARFADVSGHAPGLPVSDLSPETALRFGLTLPSGQTLDPWEQRIDFETEPDGPVLTGSGGGGGGDARRWSGETTLWLWPLPEPGLAIFHTMYQAAGIEERSFELDLRPLVEAAAGVLQLEIAEIE